jgi:hypothetical protein
MQEGVLYLKKNGAREVSCSITAIFTAYAYGLINAAQFLIFLEVIGISLNDVLPLAVKLFLLPPIMSPSFFALNVTENRKHWEEVKLMIRENELGKAIIHRFKNHPLENIIALIGSAAEFNIVYTSLQLLMQKARGPLSFMHKIGTLSAASSAIQYFIVDGQSLTDAINHGWPTLSRELRRHVRYQLGVIGAYGFALTGAATMGILAYKDSQRVFNDYYGDSAVNQSYANLTAFGIAAIYAGLDFTLYGLESVLFFLTKLNEGKWKHPKLNTNMRKAKFALALMAATLMSVVGYSALHEFFYPEDHAPLWADFLFALPALITGMQIYITEGRRLIRLRGKVDVALEAIAEHAEKSFYQCKDLLIDFAKVGYSFGVGGISIYLLTEKLNLPLTSLTIAGALVPFVTVNAASAIAIKKCCPADNAAHDTYIYSKWFMVVYALFILLTGTFSALLWKHNLTSRYGVDDFDAETNAKYLGFLIACLALLAEKPIQLVAKSIWQNLRRSTCLPNICFFSHLAENEGELASLANSDSLAMTSVPPSPTRLSVS